MGVILAMVRGDGGLFAVLGKALNSVYLCVHELWIFTMAFACKAEPWS